MGPAASGCAVVRVDEDDASGNSVLASGEAAFLGESALTSGFCESGVRGRRRGALSGLGASQSSQRVKEARFCQPQYEQAQSGSEDEDIESNALCARKVRRPRTPN